EILCRRGAVVLGASAAWRWPRALPRATRIFLWIQPGSLLAEQPSKNLASAIGHLLDRHGLRRRWTVSGGCAGFVRAARTGARHQHIVDCAVAGRRGQHDRRTD